MDTAAWVNIPKCTYTKYHYCSFCSSLEMTLYIRV